MQNFSISRKFVIVGQQLTIWTVNLLPNAIAAEGAQNRRSNRSSASVQALRINSKTIPHKLYYLDLCTSRYLPSYWTTEEDFTRNLVETSSPAQALAKLFQNHTIRRRHLKIAAIILCTLCRPIQNFTKIGTLTQKHYWAIVASPSSHNHSRNSHNSSAQQPTELNVFIVYQRGLQQ